MIANYHMPKFHHDGNIDDSLSAKQLRDCNNTEKFLYNVLEFRKIETKGNICII